VEARTVAYVGNFTRPWCTEVHVAASLETLGHTVVRLQENEVDWARLPEVVADAGADLWMWTRTWPVPHEPCFDAIARIRKAGIPSVFYHLDRWWGLEREYQIHTEPFFRLDLVVSPDDQVEKWAAAGVRHLWMPPAVYAAECGPVAPNPKRWPYDVVFVGSYPYPHRAWAAYRHELINCLRRRYGRRFGVLPRRGQAIRGRDLQELYATAKVVVGDSCLVGEPRKYWSDRIPESLGRGALLVHPEANGLADWYVNGRDLLTYPIGDFDQALAQVDWALNNPDVARRIREQGRATVLGRDTYAHRMRSVLAAIPALADV
jgi:hypothetical protein